MPEDRRRRPRAVYDVGDEPDPRFSLANERTFLAWIRTSLALLATGVALEAISKSHDLAVRFTSALLVSLAIAGPVFGFVRWMQSERALRQDRALPGGAFLPAVTLTVAVAAAITLALITG
ncbi:YidH family protein [Actinocorallia longicatena]|uniref:DUF202 domain-containing protein n=1 Tax=Actinocorallia longicatena TaxID=111803 RepID=A0ABP6Q8Q3_9ACTN